MKTLDCQTRIALKNILFMTDFSPAADAALPFAIQIARRYGATLHGLHVRPFDVFPGAPTASWTVLAEEQERAARENVRRLEERLMGVCHRVVVSQGDIWPVLEEVTQGSDIDLLVIGTRGRTGIEKMLLGSRAEEIIRRASCPVLTVGPHILADPELALKLDEILYPTALTPEPQAARFYAVSLAEENEARLTLLHVWADAKAAGVIDPAEYTEPTLRAMRSLVPEEAGLWCQPEFVIEKGNVAEKILEVADRRHADLIVLEVRGEEGFPGAATHLGGAVAHQIVARAKCPVLTVRG